MPGPEHELGGRHAGEQRDLRVVVLGRERHAVADGPRPVLAHDLLLGDLQLHAAARDLQRQPPLPDLREQLGDRRRDVGVRVLRDAADLGAGDVGGDEVPGAVEVERPQDGRGPLPREQARDALRQGERVQRRLRVGRVDGDAARVGLGVERAAGRDERRDVGDRVADAVPVAAPLDVQRLVEVARPRRVDGHEGDVDAIARPRRADGAHLRLDLGRERGGDVGLAADRLEPLLERGRGDDPDRPVRHPRQPSAASRPGIIGTWRVCCWSSSRSWRSPPRRRPRSR